MRKKQIEINLKSILKSRGIEQKTLAESTKLTERTISELCNNKVKRIPKEALEKIAVELNIEDINDLISLKNVSDD